MRSLLLRALLLFHSFASLVNAQSRRSRFNALWVDVLSKMGSDHVGLGPFPDAESKFSMSKENERFEIFKQNFAVERMFPPTFYKTELNFFALLTRSEWEMYLNGRAVNMLDMWQEAYSFLQAPTAVAESEMGDFRELNVRTPHSGAYSSHGLMPGVLHMEYMYRSIVDEDLASDNLFSTQYFLNCILSDDAQYTPTWPHEVWREAMARAHAPSPTFFPWTGERGACPGFTPNNFNQALVTSVHFRYVFKDELELLLLSKPLTVCIRVDTQNDPHFFFYRSGLYTNVVMGGLFRPCNHFVVLVSYHPDHFTLQNTWGEDWGTAGFMDISRGSVGVGTPFIISYPVMKADEAFVGKSPNTTFVEIWRASVLSSRRYYDDKYLNNELKAGQIMEVRCNSTVRQSRRHMVVVFMTLGARRNIYYGIKVNFPRGFIQQYTNVAEDGGSKMENYESIKESMNSPNTDPDKTVLRIRVDPDSFTALLNDQPLNPFPLLHDVSQLNLVEAACDGLLDVVQLEERVLIEPNSVLEEGDCSDSDYTEDCVFWRKYGFCGDHTVSKYEPFMRDKCALSCGFC